MRMARGADNLRVATTRLERRELTLRFRRLLTFAWRAGDYTYAVVLGVGGSVILAGAGVGPSALVSRASEAPRPVRFGIGEHLLASLHPRSCGWARLRFISGLGRASLGVRQARKGGLEAGCATQKTGHPRPRASVFGPKGR